MRGERRRTRLLGRRRELEEYVSEVQPRGWGRRELIETLNWIKLVAYGDFDPCGRITRRLQVEVGQRHGVLSGKHKGNLDLGLVMAN